MGEEYININLEKKKKEFIIAYNSGANVDTLIILIHPFIKVITKNQFVNCVLGVTSEDVAQECVIKIIKVLYKLKSPFVSISKHGMSGDDVFKYILKITYNVCNETHYSINKPLSVDFNMIESNEAKFGSYSAESFDFVYKTIRKECELKWKGCGELLDALYENGLRETKRDFIKNSIHSKTHSKVIFNDRLKIITNTIKESC